MGKVGIPDSILLKPGKLTEAEYEIMKTHTLVGAELLEGLMRDFGDYAMIAMGAEVALVPSRVVGRHGLPRGSGRPGDPPGRAHRGHRRRLRRPDQPRVYKEAWSHEDTIATIRAAAGRQFDPDLVEIFFASVPALTGSDREPSIPTDPSAADS